MLRTLVVILAGTMFALPFSYSQTAEDLVAKNIAAHGGMEKIKSIHSLRMQGRAEQQGFIALVAQESKAPDYLRLSFTLQGMTAVQSFDGHSGWQIAPFQGRKDPEMMGEDDLRDLSEQADFYGPLVDYQAKGNRVEFVGHDSVDGDDALRLKVTLKNGDIVYYLLDPETFLEIRVERQEFIRGSVHETFSEYGSYKQVNGVYFPFARRDGEPRHPDNLSKITIEHIDANVPMDDSLFKMPAAPSTASPQQHAEPPAGKQPGAEEKPKPPVKP